MGAPRLLNDMVRTDPPIVFKYRSKINRIISIFENFPEERECVYSFVSMPLR
jgi:hypothetical protein